MWPDLLDQKYTYSNCNIWLNVLHLYLIPSLVCPYVVSVLPHVFVSSLRVLSGCHPVFPTHDISSVFPWYVSCTLLLFALCWNPFCWYVDFCPCDPFLVYLNSWFLCFIQICLNKACFLFPSPASHVLSALGLHLDWSVTLWLNF